MPNIKKERISLKEYLLTTFPMLSFRSAMEGNDTTETLRQLRGKQVGDGIELDWIVLSSHAEFRARKC